MCGARFPLQCPGCEGGRQLQHRQDSLSQEQAALPLVLQPQAPGRALQTALRGWGQPPTRLIQKRPVGTAVTKNSPNKPI